MDREEYAQEINAALADSPAEVDDLGKCSFLGNEFKTLIRSVVYLIKKRLSVRVTLINI